MNKWLDWVILVPVELMETRVKQPKLLKSRLGSIDLILNTTRAH